MGNTVIQHIITSFYFLIHTQMAALFFLMDPVFKLFSAAKFLWMSQGNMQIFQQKKNSKNKRSKSNRMEDTKRISGQ